MINHLIVRFSAYADSHAQEFKWHRLRAIHMGRFTKPIPFVPWFGPFSESWLPAVSPAKYECDVKNLTHNSGYYEHRWWQYKWQEHKSALILPLDHLSVDKSTDVSKHGTNYNAWLSNKILHFVTRLFHHVFYNSLQCNYTAKFTLNVFCSSLFWFVPFYKLHGSDYINSYSPSFL